MATPTMHFGPEWMRPKQNTARTSQSPSSPGPANGNIGGPGSYSALVSPVPSAQPEQRDETHPFRYSKEDMLKFLKDTGRNSLGLEVERWEGIVRESPGGPFALKDLSESEKKLFAGSLNAEVRRRQSIDPLSPTATSFSERPRLSHSATNSPASPLRDRFGPLSRRKDSADQPSPIFPRKNSVTGQSPLMSPRDPSLPSPRTRPSGFDGVLNNSESWMSARRRASEAKLNSHDHIPEQPSPSPDIRQSHSPSEMAPVAKTSVADSRTEGASSNTPPTGDMATMSLNPSQPVPVAPPPPEDLSAVEWSYIDTSGVVQGPFKADLMQKWHEQGYFTHDLLMRRTNLDDNFASVKQLMAWSAGDQLFLSPLVPPIAPPDLPPMDNGPYQPAPIRSLRPNPLDTFGTASNPSESPVSSFGAPGFAGSPDPSAFGGRATGGIMPTEHSLNNPGISAGTFSTGKPMFGGGYENAVSGSPLLSNTNSNYASPWAISQPAKKSTLEEQPGFPAASYDFQHHQSNPNYPSRSSTYPEPADFDPGTAHPNGYGQFQQPQPTLTQSPIPSASIPASSAISRDVSGSTMAPTHSPWDKAPESASSARRFDPFASTHPTAFNNAPSPPVQPVPPPQPAAWEVTPRRASTNDPASWFAASRGVMDPGWGQEGAGPNSLTIDNLGQHNKQQQHHHDILPPHPLQSSPPVEIPPAVITTIITEEPEAINAAPAEVLRDAPIPASPISTPAPRKSKSKKSKEAQGTAQPPAPIDVGPTSSPTMTTPKTPWANDDAKKPASMSLREIQETEKKVEEEKRNQARKAEKARGAMSSIDEPSFTHAWGLPTSKAGARHVSSSSQKEPTIVTSAAAVAPVWNGTPSTVAPKKTMKEIQEEEERRRKMTKETTANIASRRATEPQKPIAVPPTATAWTTIGSGGKPVANRAVPLPTSSSPTVQRANGTPAVSRPAVTPSTTTPKSIPAASTSKQDDAPVIPSTEFLKWMSDALRGVDSTTNLEEIITMLLSFALDPDESTIELIGDLIYAHSKTMDGRRFAAEFVARRKMDAQRAPESSNTKPTSIADVVKAQPKPTQPEWGGFKVVKKKQKGGRS